MNKFSFFFAIPLATTATIASIVMVSNPAQAISFGTVAISGNANFEDPFNISFTNVIVEDEDQDATGIFDGLETTSVDVANLVFTEFSNAYNAVPTFLSFDNGITFNLNAGVADLFLPSQNAVDLSFAGTFFNNNLQTIGKGNFAILSSGNSTSFNLTAESVPEPITMLGTGLALGFGSLFKRKFAQKKLVKA